MKWFGNLSLFSQILSGYLGVGLIAGIIGVIGIVDIGTIHEADTRMYGKMTVPIAHLGEARESFMEMRVNVYKLLLADSDDEIRQITGKIDELSIQLASSLDEYGTTILSDEERVHYKEARQAVEVYLPLRDRSIELVRQGRHDAAEAVVTGEGLQAGLRAEAAFNGMMAFKVDAAGQTAAANAELASGAIRNMVVAMILGTLLALGIAFGISRRITGLVKQVAERAERLRSVCITELGRATEAMARGDLSVEVVPSTAPLEIESRDELGVLARTVDGMIRQTRATVGAFNQARERLHAVTGQVEVLIGAAREGRLDERGQAQGFEGTYRELIEGFNATLDAVAAPLNEASEVLQKVAAKDLTVRMQGEYRGAYDQIKVALNRALSDLQDALSQVASAAEQVGGAAGQISAGSQSLAQGANQQASSLEEVSSSLQEMTSMTRQTTANAREGNSLSEVTRERTRAGVQNMQRLSAAVSQIKGNADQTAKIVKTIDEIAFQTNLLALNAAVEAARAGEAGKGFAVVAEEVRNLAMRSAEAAKSTAELIEGSVKSVDEGVGLNAEVLRSLEEIDAQVEKVRGVMAEIAASSEEQSQGIGQINQAVEQMNAVTQQVAANSEESAAAAEQLSSQAEVMQDLMGQFELGDARVARSTAPAARPAKQPAAEARPRRVVGPAQATRVSAESLIPFDGALAEF